MSKIENKNPVNQGEGEKVWTTVSDTVQWTSRRRTEKCQQDEQHGGQ